jgi:surface antigen
MVCDGCKAPKSDSGFGGFFTLALLGSLGGFLVYGLPLLSGLTTAHPSRDAVAAPTVAASTNATSDEAPAAATASIDEPAASVSEQSAQAVADTPAFSFDIPEIRRSEIEALDKGKPVAWHADGLRGYSVASEPTITGDRECRNVYSTVDGKNAAQSLPTKMCRISGGEWQAG